MSHCELMKSTRHGGNLIFKFGAFQCGLITMLYMMIAAFLIECRMAVL